MTYALLLHLSDCLASVIPCADTLAVTTGEVSTPFNTALSY